MALAALEPFLVVAMVDLDKWADVAVLVHFQACRAYPEVLRGISEEWETVDADY